MEVKTSQQTGVVKEDSQRRNFLTVYIRRGDFFLADSATSSLGIRTLEKAAAHNKRHFLTANTPNLNANSFFWQTAFLRKNDENIGSF
jgi:hypothetical protein